jgi:calcineurin-like phosphoesterase family protein
VIYHSSDWHLDHDNILEFDKRPDANIEAMNTRVIDTTNDFVTEKDILVSHGDLCLPKVIHRDDNKGYVERIKFHLNKLRCKNIIFVCGNHDRTWVQHHGYWIPNWRLWNLFRVEQCDYCGYIWDRQKRFGFPKHCKKGCEGQSDPAAQMPIFNIHPMGYEMRLTKRICAEQAIPEEYAGMLIVCTHYSHRLWNKSHKPQKGDVGRSINLYGHSHGHLPGLRNSFDVGFNIWNRPLSLVEILTNTMVKHNEDQPPYIPHHETDYKRKSDGPA